MIRPPLKKGGRGGRERIARILGQCKKSAEKSLLGTASRPVVIPRYPPSPPFLRGDDGNGIGMKTKLVQGQVFISPWQGRRGWVQ